MPTADRLPASCPDVLGWKSLLGSAFSEDLPICAIEISENDS